jgi:hypothetical protein
LGVAARAGSTINARNAFDEFSDFRWAEDSESVRTAGRGDCWPQDIAEEGEMSFESDGDEAVMWWQSSELDVALGEQ